MKKKLSHSALSTKRKPPQRSIFGPKIVLYYTLSTFVAALVIGAASLVVPRPLQITCANSISCTNNMEAFSENTAVGIFAGQRVFPPQIDLAQTTDQHSVLGEITAAGEKHLYVDLEAQRVYAYQGTTQIFTTLVSTGKWGRTPTGEFSIWVKLRSTRMTGGSGADYYDLPNVPYTMFFSNDSVPASAGFSFHGAYWHNNFGHEMSHGCVNLREVDAQVLYDWADPVTKGTTTHSTSTSPGTAVSICNRVALHDGDYPLCIIDAAH